MSTTIFFTDCHTEADDNLDRFHALGNYIAEHKPDAVISGGDFVTLDSLSAWDLNKRGKMEGKRFRQEIDHGRLAINLLMDPIVDLQAHQRVNKKRIYSPKLIFIEGNHEDRFTRYQESSPELKGIIDLKEALNLNLFGWEWVPYRETFYHEGCAFTHIPMNGNNQPLSGQRLHINAATDSVESVFYGHTHTLSITSIARHGSNDEQVFAVNGGIFSEDVPDYAKGSKASKNWWRGFLIIEHIGEGKFDLTTFNLDRLISEYS